MGLLEQQQGGHAIFSVQNRETGVFQVEPQNLTDLAVIISHQNSLFHYAPRMTNVKS